VAQVSRLRYSAVGHKHSGGAIHNKSLGGEHLSGPGAFHVLLRGVGLLFPSRCDV